MTKPIQVVTRWERIKRLTVWHPINTDPDDDYRHGPRFWYPGYDILAVILGFVALIVGSPLLNRLFPSWFTDTMGIALILVGLATLIGVVFPKLFRLELAGKLALVFMLGGYSGTVAFMSNNSGENGFIIVILIMAVWLLGPRITWLVIRLFRAMAARKAGKEVE